MKELVNSKELSENRLMNHYIFHLVQTSFIILVRYLPLMSVLTCSPLPFTSKLYISQLSDIVRVSTSSRVKPGNNRLKIHLKKEVRAD